MLARFSVRAACAGVLAVVALGACERTAPAAPAGGLTVPPLVYTHRELPNGLDVYAMPDANTASVSVQVWYKVGSKDDPPGRSGFAHLFEHLMFKSTSNMPPETFDRLTEDAGGFNNASTWDDFTNYYAVVPANHLQRVLWGEAERMGSLVVDEANFISEREVVKNELRQNYLGQPYGRLFLYMTQTAFDVHPYGRPGIGSAEQLDASTLQDVREFHAAYYRPDNAVLVVSGNFDQKQLDAWVDQYFAPIATPDRPIPKVTAVEPARTAPRDFTVYQPNVPLPAVAITWPAPPIGNPDMPALSLLDAILTRGVSSRLYQSMVYDQQIAAQVSSSFPTNRDPGAYSLFAIMSEGHTADEGLASLKAEIERLRTTPVTQAELDEARNEILMETLDARETADGRANDLAFSVVMFDDPNASDKRLAALQSVTPADIQRVAAEVMKDQASTTLRYLPDSLKQEGQTSAQIADSPTIQATTIAIPSDQIPVYTLAAEGARKLPPSEGPAVSPTIPSFQEKTLANGLRVIVASRPGLPLVSASLRLPAGSAVDPAGQAGLASMTADLATRGTATRTAPQIAQEIESLGASLGAGAGMDAADVSVSTRSDKAAEVLAIMADVVMNPAFAQEELDRARSETLDGLMVSMRQPPAVAGMTMSRLIYGAAPYGGVMTEASVSAIAREGVMAFHNERWRPDTAVLVISGNVTAEQGFALAETAFGAWAKPSTPPPEAVDPDELPGVAPAGPSAVVVDIPDIGQATVSMGQFGPARNNERFFPTLVANGVLGGGYSARLNAEIRIKRGLSYGAGASLPQRKARSSIVASAQTGNPDVAAVIDLMTAELKRLGAEPIPETELNARKAVLVGSFGRSVETNSGLAGQLSALAQFGLPLDRLSTYASEVLAVTAEQAADAARAYYDPAKATVVVVGDAKVFWNAVRQRLPAARRINIETLNLDKAELQ